MPHAADSVYPAYTVHLHKHTGKTISYPADLIERTATQIVLRAVWSLPPVDLGMLQFAPGDLLYETFYTDRWYNVFAVYTPQHTLKGWYCNLARPARLHAASVESDDLLLDLVVLPDGSAPHLLDQAEYAAWGLAQHDPAAAAAVDAALHELHALSRAALPPFVAHPEYLPVEV